MIVSAVVFLGSAGMLIYIFMGYQKADNIYSDIEDSVFTPVTKVETTHAAPRPNTPAATNAPADDNNNANNDNSAVDVMTGFTYNHEALLKINTDSLGYLIVPAINIRLPLVQGSDNSFYLSHAINGEYSANGTLFVDSGIENPLETQNTIIYGHAMKNGSMFGSLYHLKNDGYVHSGNNDTILIYTGNQIYTYKIYSVHNAPAISDTYTIGFEDDEAFMEYVDAMRSQSFVSSDLVITPEDKTITLSTCTNNEEIRLVVQAVRVSITQQ